MISKKEKLIWLLFGVVLVFLFLLSSTDLIIKEEERRIYPISVIVEDTSDASYVNFRKGMDRAAVRAILSSGIPHVALISCNPSTLARDLGLLTGALTETEEGLKKNPDYTPAGMDGFYKILSVQPFDMFPQTRHIEVFVCLERN